jgi:hypothetical protein
MTTPFDIDPLEELQQANAEKIQTCIRRGIQLDPITQLKLRLDVLTAFAVAAPFLDQFEYAYEHAVGDWLDQVIDAANPTILVPK